MTASSSRRCETIYSGQFLDGGTSLIAITYFIVNLHHQETVMKAFAILALGFLGAGVLAQTQCAGSVWYLEPDDCICMNSRNGTLLKTQTLGCCRSLGYKTYDNVSSVHTDMMVSRKDVLTKMSGLCCRQRQTPRFQGLLQRPEAGERHWALPLGGEHGQK